MPRRQVLSADLLRRLAVALGLLVSVVMVVRAQAGGDQLNLLARGWLLAERASRPVRQSALLRPGDEPGTATTLLVGCAALRLVGPSPPVVLIWLPASRCLGAARSDRSRTVFTPWERTAFAVVYSLNPWRYEASAFLSESELPLLRRRARIWPRRSTNASGPGPGPPSCTSWRSAWARSSTQRRSLIVASSCSGGAGWSRVGRGRHLRHPHARPLVAAAASRRSSLRRGLSLPRPDLVSAAAQGALLLVAIPLVADQQAERDLRLQRPPRRRSDRMLTPLAKGLVGVAGVTTMGAVLLANVDFFRRRYRRWRACGVRPIDRARPLDPRRFVEDYAFWCVVAAVDGLRGGANDAAELAGVPLFQAAVVPVVFWLGRPFDAPVRAALPPRAARSSRRPRRRSSSISRSSPVGRTSAAADAAASSFPLRAASRQCSTSSACRRPPLAFDAPAGGGRTCYPRGSPLVCYGWRGSGVGASVASMRPAISLTSLAATARGDAGGIAQRVDSTTSAPTSGAGSAE